MPSRQALRRTITFSAIGLVLLAVVVILTFWSAGQQEKGFAAVTHTLEVENQVRGVFNRVQTAESSQRGFLLIGDEAYLAPIDQALGDLDATLDKLAGLVADNAMQMGAFNRLRPVVADRVKLMRDTVARYKSGDHAGAVDQVRQGEGLIQMESIRTELRAMIAEEERLMVDRRAEAADLTWRVRAGLIAGFALILILAAAAILDARRRIKEVMAARDLLADANARLHAESASRAAAEGKLRQSQKMEAVGQLTGGIAHDFNNMLAIIIGSLDLVRRRMRSDPDRAETGIAAAQEGAQRAASLTNRLLAFSRQQALAPAVCEMNKVVSSMSELLRRTLGEQIEIETVLSGGLWRIFADASQLENALLNLCVNARDAMPDGGKLTIETENAFLDDAYAAEHAEVEAGQYVMVSVTDTGSGMSAETIERAFDPFYTTKGVGKGTGLGLSQVFGFVKQSHGHVKIYSEVDRGTTLKLYLPRYTGEAVVAAMVAPVITAHGTETILVVEDEPNVRRVTVDTLRELGYTVIHASGGREALAQFDANPKIDLLFTDIVMPEMTGRQLADEAVKLRPDLKVLYATGYTRNAVVHNGMLDAGVAFMTKPFTMEQLAVKVRAVLDGGGINRAV